MCGILTCGQGPAWSYHYHQLKYWSTHRCTVINSYPSSLQPLARLLFTPASEDSVHFLVIMANIWTLLQALQWMALLSLNVDRMFRLRLVPCQYVCPSAPGVCTVHSTHVQCSGHGPGPQSQSSSRPVNMMSHKTPAGKTEYWTNRLMLDASRVFQISVNVSISNVSDNWAVRDILYASECTADHAGPPWPPGLLFRHQWWHHDHVPVTGVSSAQW